jgi:hypothetical protein
MALPTIMMLPSPTERIIQNLFDPPETPSPFPTFTDAFSEFSTPSPTPSITWTPTATETSTPTITPTRKPLPDAFIFGRSVAGRDLIARRFGQGDRLLMLVGGIHGGWESNTVTLMNELVGHFQTSPNAVQAGMSIVVISELNPDGVAKGITLEGRFNANRVDLNRNWDCGWEPIAYFRDDEVNPGTHAFSEPESQALAALIYEIRPDAVLFYHSAANGVFAGGCGGDSTGSYVLSEVVGRAAGYNYGSDFSNYTVTGTAPAWVNSIGIPSADVELATWQTSEFDRNLRAVNAVQCWLLGASAQNSGVCNR